MKGSKELIEHYNKREEELGEKATKLNMYLEGYAEGYRDTKVYTKAYMIEKAYEWFQYNAWSFGNYAQGDSSYEWEMAFECFRKSIEEQDYEDAH